MREVAFSEKMTEGETSGGYRIRPYKVSAAVHAVGAESISARTPIDQNHPIVILRRIATKNLKYRFLH